MKKIDKNDFITDVIAFLVILFVLIIGCISIGYLFKNNSYKQQMKKIDTVKIIDIKEKEHRTYYGNVKYNEDNNMIILEDSTLLDYKDLSNHVE